MGRPPSTGAPAFCLLPSEVAEMEAHLQQLNNGIHTRAVCRLSPTSSPPHPNAPAASPSSPSRCGTGSRTGSTVPPDLEELRRVHSECIVATPRLEILVHGVAARRACEGGTTKAGAGPRRRGDRASLRGTSLHPYPPSPSLPRALPAPPTPPLPHPASLELSAPGRAAFFAGGMDPWRRRPQCYLFESNKEA